jgi:flagellar hook-basal body complex protein FliE
MEVRLRPFDFTQAATKAGMPQVADRVRASADAAGLSGTRPASQAAEAVAPAGFQSVLNQALRAVSDAQSVAQTLQRDVSMDKPGASIEQTMIAMQKSQVGFQAAVQVRNRLVQAYNDIMNMQV